MDASVVSEVRLKGNKSPPPTFPDPGGVIHLVVFILSCQAGCLLKHCYAGIRSSWNFDTVLPSYRLVG